MVSTSLPITNPCAAQQTQPSSNAAAAVKRRVAQLSPGDKISVVRRDAPEAFGTYLAMSDDDFSFYDVDLKTDVHLKYESVRRVKNGYGGYNTVRHRHTDRTKGLVITAAIVVGVAVVLGVALSKDK